MRDAQEQLEIESIVLRICWMLVFAFAWQLAAVVLSVVVVVQLCCRLLQGRLNRELLQAGDSLSHYLAQIGRFASFNTEDKPWPFADWPTPESAADSAPDASPGKEPRP